MATKRQMVDTESKVMKALQVVMEHTGTRNAKKLKTIIETTETLEQSEKMTAWEENMKAWSLANIHTLTVVTETLNLLASECIDPFDDESMFMGRDIPYFQQKLENEIELKHALQCIATRGYDAEVWIETTNVCFRFGNKSEKHDFYYTFPATPCQNLDEINNCSPNLKKFNPFAKPRELSNT